MSTTAISIRLDSDIKERFDQLCKELGLSTNAAFNLFARAVVREEGIPFPITLAGTSKSNRAIAAVKSLNKIQELSSKEDHELTEEEIDEIISNYRKKKN